MMDLFKNDVMSENEKAFCWCIATHELSVAHGFLGVVKAGIGTFGDMPPEMAGFYCLVEIEFWDREYNHG